MPVLPNRPVTDPGSAGATKASVRLFFLILLAMLLLGCQQVDSPPPAPLLGELPNLDSMDDAAKITIIRRYLFVEEMLQRSPRDVEALAFAHGNLGMAFHAYHKFSLAEPNYLQAYQHNPDSFRWCYLLGTLYADMGFPDRALRYYSESLERLPTYPPALIHQAEISLDQNDIEAAEAGFNRVLTHQPNHASARLGIGRVLLAKGDLDRAVATFEGLLADEPHMRAVHHHLALAYRDLGQLEQAQHHLDLNQNSFRKMNDPILSEVHAFGSNSKWARMGRQHLLNGAPQTALVFFERILLDKHDDMNGLRGAGAAHFALGNYRKAKRIFDKILRLDGDHSQAHYYLGTMALREGALNRALLHLEQTVHRDSEHADAHFNLAKAYERLGRFAEAARYSGKAAQLNHGDPLVLYWHGVHLLRAGRYQAGQALLERGHTAFPEDSNIKELLIRTLIFCPAPAACDRPRALTLAHQLVAQHSTWKHVRALALAHGAQGNQRAAERHQQQAIELAKGKVSARYSAALLAELANLRRAHISPNLFALEDFGKPAQIPTNP